MMTAGSVRRRSPGASRRRNARLPRCRCRARDGRSPDADQACGM